MLWSILIFEVSFSRFFSFIQDACVEFYDKIKPRPRANQIRGRGEHDSPRKPVGQFPPNRTFAQNHVLSLFPQTQAFQKSQMFQRTKPSNRTKPFHRTKFFRSSHRTKPSDRTKPSHKRKSCCSFRRAKSCSRQFRSKPWVIKNIFNLFAALSSRYTA